jgi:hypothetical protein
MHSFLLANKLVLWHSSVSFKTMSVFPAKSHIFIKIFDHGQIFTLLSPPQ